MKYIKKYELYGLGELDLKSKEYEKYSDKFVIFSYKPWLILAKFIKIILNGYFAKLIIYKEEHDEQVEYYPKNSFDLDLHLDEFSILKSFDTFEEADKEFELMLAAKKYNL